MFGKKLFDPPPVDIPGEGELRVDIETSMGTITGRLFEESAPKTVGNFVGLATGTIKTGEAYYDGLIFHRVIPDFMVQCGCPEGKGTGGPGYVISDEFGADLHHDRAGVFSMANAGPNTGGSQFFITDTPTPWLDGKHAIFGEVLDGLDIVHKIAHAPTGPGDRPSETITMNTLRVYRQA